MSLLLAAYLVDGKYHSKHKWRTVLQVPLCIWLGAWINDLISKSQWGPCCCSDVWCSLRPGTNFLSEIKVYRFPESQAQQNDRITVVKKDGWIHVNSRNSITRFISTCMKCYILKSDIIAQQTNRQYKLHAVYQLCVMQLFFQTRKLTWQLINSPGHTCAVSIQKILFCFFLSNEPYFRQRFF